MGVDLSSFDRETSKEKKMETQPLIVKFLFTGKVKTEVLFQNCGISNLGPGI